MNNFEYKQMYHLESFYWWFVARRRLVSEFMRQEVHCTLGSPRILDAGCGTGLNLTILQEFGRVFGADSSETALRFCRSRGIQNLALSDLHDLAVADDSFDVITALDVLEHADDDVAAMHELWRVLKPGGSLLITVPAYGFLWSEHDEALHHRRRYAAYELRNKLAVAGFDVSRCTYFITLLFFPIMLLRIAQNLFKDSVEPKTSHIILPEWLNSLLVRMLDAERLLLRVCDLPFGVSLVCVANKRLVMEQEPEPVHQVEAGEAVASEIAICSLKS